MYLIQITWKQYLTNCLKTPPCSISESLIIVPLPIELVLHYSTKEVEAGVSASIRVETLQNKCNIQSSLKSTVEKEMHSKNFKTDPIILEMVEGNGLLFPLPTGVSKGSYVGLILADSQYISIQAHIYHELNECRYLKIEVNSIC